MTDVAIVSNTGNVVTTGNDVLTTCPTNSPAAPEAPVVAFEAEKKYVTISWTDASTNEIGFRIDRKDGTGEWKTIVFRPRKSAGSTFNEQIWRDYLYPKNINFQYRVVAIDCNNNNAGASPASVILNSGSTANLIDFSNTEFKILKDKIVFNSIENHPYITISDISGKILVREEIKKNIFSFQNLASGIYLLIFQSDIKTITTKIVR